MAPLLVVDDDPSLRFLVGRALRAAGYEVDEVGDGLEALHRYEEREPELVVLDVDLPTLDGWEVLAELRRHGETPVVMLTALEDEAHRVQGLEMGADDYLGKPFSPAELVARVRSVLRRTQHRDHPPAFHLGEMDIDVGRRQVLVDGHDVELTKMEFNLLVFMALHPRQVMDRQTLLEKVWASSGEWQDPTTVTEHIRRLRLKIGNHWIRTVRGAGYEFQPGVA